MKFKELKEEDKQYLTHFYYDTNMSHSEKMEVLTDKYGVTERSIRRWWKQELNLSQYFSKLPSILQKAQQRNINKDTDILLVTAAQNKTGINNGLLLNIKKYKMFLESLGHSVEIIIAPSKYRNPTSPTEQRTSKDQVEDWWRDEIHEFLHYGKLTFGDVLISTDSRILPTAKKPLTSFEVLAKDNSLVLAHPRIHFKTLPRFKNKPLRSMSTTGFLTHKNYSDSRSGETAFQHHSYGFVIVEKKKDGTCHVPRNVKADSDGNFIDLIYSVENEKVSIIKSTKGIVLGDLHASEVNMEVFEKTLELYDIFKPKETVVHDALDASTVNPHEQKDMFIQRLKIREKRYLIEDEIEHCFDILGLLIATGSNLNVVVSNHDIFLDRHVNDGNWKRDLHNSPAYLKMALIQQEVDLREYGSIFGYMLKERFGNKATYINFGDSLDIGTYECGLHADHGVNGARGSALSFSKLNTKMIGAHSHSPLILDGYTCVGVIAKLNQYYTRKGLSSWAHAHSIIHENDKNQLLVFGDDYKISSLI
jgi:hypothetical protein